MNEILELWTPETTFSFIFMATIVGLGLWFTKSFWPWVIDYSERKLDLQHQRELLQRESALENERLWREVIIHMTEAVNDLKIEVVGLREVVAQSNKQNEMIYMMFAKLNGVKNA